ncbi:MAG: hypothetical protein HOD64_02250 [Candidatus Cloacimonetes bacterium]|jgi:hypothetical protein|nr:hypothetical protein [Candidatus Cloacimonadota bacterium]MBT4576116.1 hypothetical protein [Candidatus Cloacimonadota bacterium]
MVEMVKRISILFIVLSFFACSPTGIKLTGNIETGVTISDEGAFSNILNELASRAEYALLIGNDGTAALISARSFDQILIEKHKNNWNSKSNVLPAVCNIRNLKEICIYTKTSFENNHFSDRINEFEFLGESCKNGYYVRKYKEHTGE